MNQQQAKLFVWWLLPFLAVRALVPAGFMADVASGNFKLVLCSEITRFIGVRVVDSTSVQSASSTSSTGDTHSGSLTHAPCPFAASAAAALATANGVPEFSDAHQAHVLIVSAITFVLRNDKAHAIRGPPVFS